MGAGLRRNPWRVNDTLFTGESSEARFAVLVFSKTTGFRHDSISARDAAIAALGDEHSFAVDTTEDAARFSDASLARYKAVVFLNTTGDILDAGQKAANPQKPHKRL
jgi:cytochrome c